MATVAESLQKRIEDALLSNEKTKDAEIEVIVDNNIVTLGGSVNSMKVRDAAEMIVEDQEGVAQVINQIDVLPESGEELPPPPEPKNI